jgi:hypothetical protein
MPGKVTACPYFTTYSGAKLPLKLVGELDENDMRNRNTYFRGSFDDAGQPIVCEKVGYSEIDLPHEYSYHPMAADAITADRSRQRRRREKIFRGGKTRRNA